MGVPSVSIATLKWIRNDVHVFQLLNMQMLPYIIGAVMGFVRIFGITISNLYVGGNITYMYLLHKSLNEMQ